MLKLLWSDDSKETLLRKKEESLILHKNENTCSNFSKYMQISSSVSLAPFLPNCIPHRPPWQGWCWIHNDLRTTLSSVRNQTVGRGGLLGFSYWINRFSGTATFALCVDRSFSWFVSPAESPAGPRLVKHSWVHAGIKAKVSFDGTSHFSVQQSALWELEGKWIVARVAHPVWVETTALSFITRTSAGSAEPSRGRWINYT